MQVLQNLGSSRLDDGKKFATCSSGLLNNCIANFFLRNSRR